MLIVILISGSFAIIACELLHPDINFIRLEEYENDSKAVLYWTAIVTTLFSAGPTPVDATLQRKEVSEMNSVFSQAVYPSLGRPVVS